MSGDGVVQAGERLSNWAASLLPAAEVTPSTMRKIFKPSTAPLLAFLEEHVLSSVRSRDIRENILLQTKRHELAIADSEHEEACAEHEEILEEVLATRQNIDSLQVEVEHLKAELQAAEEKLLMAKEPVEQRQTRSVITGAFVLRTGEAVIRTRGFAQRLETAVEALEMKPSRITETHPEYPGQDKQTDDVQNVVANAIEATRNLLFQDSLATLQCKPSKASPRDQALTEAVSTEAKNEFENAIASSLVNGGARPSDILSQALSMCARAQDEVGRPEIAQDFTNTTDASPRHALTSSLLKWQDLHIADERTGALSKHKTEELTHPVLTDLLRFLEGSAQTWITHHSAFFEWELLAALEKELHEMHDALQIPEPMRPTSTSTPGKLFSALSGKGMTDEFARQFVANNESLSALVIRHEQMALYGIKSVLGSLECAAHLAQELSDASRAEMAAFATSRLPPLPTNSGNLEPIAAILEPALQIVPRQSSSQILAHLRALKLEALQMQTDLSSWRRAIGAGEKHRAQAQVEKTLEAVLQLAARQLQAQISNLEIRKTQTDAALAGLPRAWDVAQDWSEQRGAACVSDTVIDGLSLEDWKVRFIGAAMALL